MNLFQSRPARIASIACFAAVSFLFAASPLDAARPNAARLLPETTKLMVSAPNVRELARKFMNTNLGRITQDPEMQPVFEAIYGSVGEMYETVKEGIGLSLSEIAALPQGEITFALVDPTEGNLGAVFLFEAGDQIANARKLLKLYMSTMKLNREETIGDVKCSIYEELGNPGKDKLIVFEKDDSLAFCSNIDVAKQMLDLWNGKQDAHSLADNASFAAIANRCRGSKGEEPQILWYLDYIGILKNIAQNNIGLQIAVASFPAFGLDGLSGLGGSILLDTEQYDSQIHVHLLLASPRTGALKAIAFEPGATKPERWVPGDVTSYATLHWNFATSLKTVETLFDSFNGDGAFAKNFNDVNKELDIDFQKQIIPALDGRVTYFSWIEKPVTVQSSQFVVAFKLKDKEKDIETIQKILDRAVQKDKEGRTTSHTSSGKSYYRGNNPAPKVEAGQQPPPMSQPCFGIVEDYFVFSTAPGIYEQVLATAADSSKSLGNELEFKLVASKLERAAGATKPAMLIFQRPEESLRYWYDLATSEDAKAGLQKEAENNPFMKSVHSALEKHPLPPFSVIQKYLAPSGGMVIDDETGIHFMNFTLKRKAE